MASCAYLLAGFLMLEAPGTALSAPYGTCENLKLSWIYAITHPPYLPTRDDITTLFPPQRHNQATSASLPPYPFPGVESRAHEGLYFVTLGRRNRYHRRLTAWSQLRQLTFNKFVLHAHQNLPRRSSHPLSAPAVDNGIMLAMEKVKPHHDLRDSHFPIPSLQIPLLPVNIIGKSPQNVASSMYPLFPHSSMTS